MKTAILYLSKHGTTEKVARIIGDKLEEKDTELINLEKVQPSLDQYDKDYYWRICLRRYCKQETNLLLR